MLPSTPGSATDAVAAAPMTKAAGVERRPRPAWLRFMADEPLGALGLLVVATLVVLVALARFIAPYDPLEVDFMAMLQAPSAAHIMGTDQMGRDVFSRLLYGGTTALSVGVISAFLGCTLGALIGTASAYFGGKIDLYVQRVNDIVLVFPGIVLAMVIVSLLGRGQVMGLDLNVILAIAIPIVPQVVRVIRSSALTLRELPYIDAARAAGFSHLRIICRHMAPNVMAIYLILLTVNIAQAILLEASLSFLGLGITEPKATWGLMLSGASQYYRDAPWLIIFPGIAIGITVFAFNLLGDALRDWLDPRLRR